MYLHVIIYHYFKSNNGKAGQIPVMVFAVGLDRIRKTFKNESFAVEDETLRKKTVHNNNNIMTMIMDERDC